VRALDNLRCGFKGNLSGLDCQLIVGSILDRALVREAMKGVDFVFHLAAMVSVAESMQKPNECAEINAWDTAIVLEEAARARVKKLIFSSSAAIYGVLAIPRFCVRSKWLDVKTFTSSYSKTTDSFSTRWKLFRA
jgi:UDP-glucose 4-epimerase